MEWVLNEFATVIVLIAFAAAALNAFLSKTPVNFWAGDEIKAAEITDIKAYNRANGFIWAFMGLAQLIAAVFMPINSFLGNIFSIGGIAIGIPIAIIAYKKIEKKYRIKTEKGTVNKK